MTSPYLSLPVRNEKVRELIRAKIRAWDAYQAHGHVNISGKSEDERVDIEMESRRLYQAYQAAIANLCDFERENPEAAA